MWEFPVNFWETFVKIFLNLNFLVIAYEKNKMLYCNKFKEICNNLHPKGLQEIFHKCSQEFHKDALKYARNSPTSSTWICARFFSEKKGFQKLGYLNYSLWIILNVFTGSSENSYENLWKCPLTNLMIFFTIFLKNLKKKQFWNFLFPPNISEQFFHNSLKLFSRNF